MKKVVKIDQDQNIVLVGDDDGGVTAYDMESFSFNPNLGDLVEVFETDDFLVVNKLKETDKASGGIVIHNNMSQVAESAVQVDMSRTRVKKWTYFLLACFLGGIGAHHFYSGNTGKGFLYLLFCWTMIPVLLSLFTVISVLFTKADNNGYIYV